MIKKKLNSTFISKLLKIADNLEIQADECPTAELKKLEDAAIKTGKAWSGSWFGYHSRVYYKDLQSPPPGARFSIEWGFMDVYSNDTIGDWVEYQFDELYEKTKEIGGKLDINKLQEESKKILLILEDSQSKILSLLTTIELENKNDDFLYDLTQKIKQEKALSYEDYIYLFRPKGTLMTRDSQAANDGMHTPPHIKILAEVKSIISPYISCKDLGKLVRRVASHLENRGSKDTQSKRIGTNVLIGHGNSLIWKDLKDFIQERLHLPWDEFNRVPIAGITNITRLSQMLEKATIAFIIMTAEDEQVDGKVRARMNVIHEAGLFQGRLGFEKTIILLEEGCEEFSNIHGLGQIRFPKGKISATFEEIRRVLEREEIISA